jgi:hypothetical protein
MDLGDLPPDRSVLAQRVSLQKTIMQTAHGYGFKELLGVVTGS